MQVRSLERPRLSKQKKKGVKLGLCMVMNTDLAFITSKLLPT